MLEAEIEDIELAAQSELTPLLVSMSVDPLRRGRQVIGMIKSIRLVELLVAAFADDGRATAVAGGRSLRSWQCLCPAGSRE